MQHQIIKDMAKKLSSMDKQWQTEEDARALARYQEMMSNSKRKAAAMKQLKSQVSELEKRVNAMKMAYGERLKK